MITKSDAYELAISISKLEVNDTISINDYKLRLDDKFILIDGYNSYVVYSITLLRDDALVLKAPILLTKPKRRRS